MGSSKITIECSPYSYGQSVRSEHANALQIGEGGIVEAHRVGCM